MTKKPVRTFILFAVLLLASAVSCPYGYAQTAEKKDIPSFLMTGSLALQSNYVERGLTQTNKDPALQGSVSFNFGPQFKMGLWGSNVNYGTSEHFLLKANAELMVPVSASTEVDFGYHQNKYFQTETRDGSTMYLKIVYEHYHFKYEAESNWEGTGAPSSHYIFGVMTDLSPSWKWDNEVGYNMLTDDSYTNYFHLRSSALYLGGNKILYNISASYATESSQFHGHGDLAIYVGASRDF